MSEPQTYIVTGAFGYSGKYIAQRLLDKGYQVKTITNSLHRQNPFGNRVQAFPFNFENPDKLTKSLEGATVLFGKEDILINNIAWLLRQFPFLGIFGDGNYRLQPIYVDDLAKLAVKEGESRENVVINAIGPETFTYRQLVGEIGTIIGKRRPLVRISPWLGYLLSRAIGMIVKDVLITRDEIDGLMDGFLYVDSPAAGETKLTTWAREHAASLGQHYASELARRIDRTKGYDAS